MSEAVTTESVIETITEAGMDYHDFKCGIIAKNVTIYRTGGLEVNLWQEIAEFGRRSLSRTDWLRAWELAGVPIPEIYEEAA